MRGSITLPRYLKRGLSLFVCAALIGCQMPQSAPPNAGLPAPGGSAGGSVETPSLQAIDTQIVGRADFPQLAAGYGVQAASEYLTNGATLTLVSLTDNMTVVTGRTQADGTFVLPLNSFTPAPNTYYLLEASRGLGNHAAGNAVARFRTYLRWTGTAWTSISGSTIVINAQTTAVAIISSLDVANVPVPGTMSKISGTNILPTPVLNGHDDAEIFSLASTLSNYLTNDFDPVGSTTGLTPRVNSLQPANPTLNGVVLIEGNGFSPIPTGNTVRFEGAMASIFAATPEYLWVNVPGDAPNFGNVTVETSTGVSTGDNAYYTISASGGGSGGGGEGGGGSGEGTGGFAISSLQPALGVPGDTIMIRGSGFSSNPVSNTVVFSQGATASVSYADPATLVVQVPEDAISGALRVTVAGSTRGFFFNVNLPTVASFSPHDGNGNSVVTIRGQNFGTQHSTSRVLFNGLPMTNFIRWSPNEIVLNAPAPTLAQRVTGRISIINDQDRLGRVSADTFTGRNAYDETFTGTTLRHASTTADWSGGQLRLGAVTPILNHSGRALNRGSYVTNNFISFTNDGARLLTRAVRHHDGTLTESNSSWYMQMGVDDSFYYLAGNVNGTVARRRYSLLTGAQDAQWTAKETTYETKIWDPTHQVYYTYYYARARRSPAWNSPAAEDLPNGYVFNYTTSYLIYAMATNGNFVVAPNNGTGWYTYRLDVPLPYSTVQTLSPSPNISFSSVNSMAGFAGYPRILVQDSSTDISSLKFMDLSNMPGSTSVPTGPVSLPGLSLNRFGPSSNLIPRIGSDGVDLYVLAKNPMINNNADSLIKFNLNTDTHTLTRANAFDAENVLNGTLTSPVITLPDNNIWHTLEYGHGAPGGTSLTVDILNADTGVPIPGWTNVEHGRDLNTLTTRRIQLRATLTGSPENSPILNWWRVTHRGSLALSQAFDTGSIDPIFETETVTRDNENFEIRYQSSAGGTGAQDTWTWSAWNADPTALTGRYIRFRVIFNRSNGRLTRVRLPYTY